MQVLCSSVAIFFLQNAHSQKVDRLSIFSGTSLNFPPLEIARKTSCAPHGPVRFWHSTESPPFPLVSLILGCFIKVLHQIWNNKRLRGKLMQSGGSQRCQITIQEKCVYVKHDYRCNAIPIPRSSLWLHIWGPPRNYWKQLYKLCCKASKSWLQLRREMWVICLSKFRGSKVKLETIQKVWINMFLQRENKKET